MTPREAIAYAWEDVPSDELIEHYKRECYRYVNGACTTGSCLRRGGWKPGGVRNVDAATCVARETVTALSAKAAEIVALKARLAAAETALLPFAEAAYSLDDADDGELWERPAAMEIECRHLRTAAAYFDAKEASDV